MFEHDIKDASKKKNIFRNNFFLLFVNRLYHENEAASYFSFLNIHYRKFQLTWKKNEMNANPTIRRFYYFRSLPIKQYQDERRDEDFIYR